MQVVRVQRVRVRAEHSAEGAAPGVMDSSEQLGPARRGPVVADGDGGPIVQVEGTNVDGSAELLSLTSQIVAAHLSNNAVPQGGVAGFIQSVFDSLSALGARIEVPAAAPAPAVAIRRSVTGDHIVCLDDGMKLKMLKRHLMTHHGLTPDEYRARWGLKPDYPMVAPNYAAKRLELAKQIGLGRKAKPKPKGKPKSGRGRRKSAA
jgi:predicted transcriptional regulator